MHNNSNIWDNHAEYLCSNTENMGAHFLMASTCGNCSTARSLKFSLPKKVITLHQLVLLCVALDQKRLIRSQWRCSAQLPHADAKDKLLKRPGGLVEAIHDVSDPGRQIIHRGHHSATGSNAVVKALFVLATRHTRKFSGPFTDDNLPLIIFLGRPLQQQ